MRAVQANPEEGGFRGLTGSADGGQERRGCKWQIAPQSPMMSPIIICSAKLDTRVRGLRVCGYSDPDEWKQMTSHTGTVEGPRACLERRKTQNVLVQNQISSPKGGVIAAG